METFPEANTWERVSGDASDYVVGILDLNGDDRVDFLLETSYGETSSEGLYTRQHVFRASINSGNGSFSETIELGAGPSLPESGISAETLCADLNDDQSVELYTGSAQFTISPDLQFTHTGSFPAFPDTFSIPVWDRPSDVAFIDYDLDGDKDFFSIPPGIGAYTLTLTENLESGEFATPRYLSSPSRTPFNFQLAVRSCPSEGDDAFVVLERSETNSHSIFFYRLSEDGDPIPFRTIDLPFNESGTELFWHDIQTFDDGRILALAFRGSDNLVFTIDSSSNATLLRSDHGYFRATTASLADIDGDELPDLTFPPSSEAYPPYPQQHPVIWHKGSPGGGFEEASNFIAEGFAGTSIIGVADHGKDGRFELLITSRRNPETGINDFDQISVVESLDKGQSWTSHPLDLGRDTMSIIAEVDIDGDFLISPATGAEYTITADEGDRDFLIQSLEFGSTNHESATHRFEWLLQSEDGSFHLYPLRSESRSQTCFATVPAGSYTTAADWNGDGFTDIVTYTNSDVTEQSELLIFHGEPRSFSDPTQLISQAGLHGFYLADLDSDDDIDLLISGNFSDGYYYWFENDGEGNILSSGLFEGATPLGSDVDGDGKDDFFETSQNYNLKKVLLSRENQTFATIDGYLPHGPGIYLMDIDGDGDLDGISGKPISGISEFDALFWLENVGNKRFEEAREIIGTPRWFLPRDFEMIDVDLDGIKDLSYLSTTHPRLEWIKISHTPELEQYSNYISLLGLSGNSAGPLLDWDLDGILNWDEFAFGSDAGTPDRNHPGLPALRNYPEGSRYSFQRRIDASSLGLSYSTRSSTDLASWGPWIPGETTSPADPGYERVELPVIFDKPNEYFQVEVSDPPEP